MFQSQTAIRVRYAETDQMGYVYHGNYAQYYEVGRVESLRQMGLSYKMFEESGIMMPVLYFSCKFFKPAKYDDLLTIKTIVKEKPWVRIHFFYEVYNEQEILLGTGETTLVFIDMKTNRPVKCPDILAAKLDSYFSSGQ